MKKAKSLIGLAAVLVLMAAAVPAGGLMVYDWWYPHSPSCEILVGGGDYGSPLLASASTNANAAPSDCRSARAVVRGNLFGDVWETDSGYVNGLATAPPYYGQCVRHVHYSKKTTAIWQKTVNPCGNF